MTTVITRILIISQLPVFQSFFLFGPRGSGKSTLIKEYLVSCGLPHLIYDLLAADTYLRLQSKPWLLRTEIESFLKLHSGQVLQIHVDEVQKIPILLDEIHSLIETHKKNIRFILSGSSARKLKRGNANLLGGRAWKRNLYSFSLLEVQEHISLEKLVQFGGLPAVVLAESEAERKEFLKSYVQTYLQEEIQAEALTRNIEGFHRFLEAAAQCHTELINMSNMAQEAMVQRTTTATFYEILEDTLVGFFLDSWGRQRSRKDVVTHGKFYFFDNGVVNTFTLNLNTDLTTINPLFGKLFEAFVIQEFVKLHAYKNTEHKIGFFRTRNGAEVDLIDERVDRLRAIEIKATAHPSKKHLSGLLSFSEEFKTAELILVCLIPRPMQLGKVRCVPCVDFLMSEKMV